jgi:AraC-like DNA-binding protein
MARTQSDEVVRGVVGEPSVATLAFMTPFVEAARALGHVPESGTAPPGGERDDGTRRLPVEAAACVIADAGEALGRPAFHLYVAEQAPLGSFDLIEAVMRHERNVRGLLEAAARFSRLLFDYPVELTVDGSDACLSIAAPTTGGHIVVEAFFARLVFAVRETTRERYSPRAVHLQHEAPRYRAELARIFDAPLSFRHHADELVFDAALLDRETVTADAQLARILGRVAEQTLERLPTDDNFVSRVRQVIADFLPDVSPSTNRVAQKLGMSGRTLQRKLNEAATSYQQLLDGVRLDLSIEYLTKSQMPIAEAATLLGFADLTSFHRAFKRWMGTPPAEFRRSLKSS